LIPNAVNAAGKRRMSGVYAAVDYAYYHALPCPAAIRSKNLEASSLCGYIVEWL
jgi:hypothetical protein